MSELDLNQFGQFSDTRFIIGEIPINIFDEGGLRVARCDFDGDCGHPDAHANARFFAAAPEFLRLLKAATAERDAWRAELLSQMNLTYGRYMVANVSGHNEEAALEKAAYRRIARLIGEDITEDQL